MIGWEEFKGRRKGSLPQFTDCRGPSALGLGLGDVELGVVVEVLVFLDPVFLQPIVLFQLLL